MFCVATWATVRAQDIHYSQQFNSPLNLSPALAGLFGGQHRVIGNARQQWRTVPVNYLTGSLSYDTKLAYRPGAGGFWGVGAQLNYDRGGFGDMTLAQLGLNLSRTQRLSDRHLVTVGAQLAAGQRGFDADDLVYPDEWNRADPTAPTPTAQAFDRERQVYPSLSAGANWRYQVRDARTFVNLGGGLYHLNTPEVNFREEAPVELDRRYSAYVLGTYEVAPRFDLIANFTYQWQGPHAEPLAGLRGKFYVTDPLLRTLAFQVGAHWRLEDAVSPVVALNVDRWEVGFSYDLNVQGFHVATDAAGGPELSVIYTFRPIRPEICLLCPEYL